VETDKEITVIRKALWVVAVLLILAFGTAAKESPGVPADYRTQAGDPCYSSNLIQRTLESVTLPAGFEMTVFACNVPGARSLEWTPNGTLFVGTRNQGVVYYLRDDNFDGVADGVGTIASGLYQPNGVAFKDGSLYVAEITRILRYDNIEANLAAPPQPVVITTGLPDAHHGWKYLRFGPDGRLYFQIGAPCNICNESDPRYATVVSVAEDGTDLQIFAQGVRNSVGMDWHPVTGELWFTDNGRDSMGDDLPLDELNHAPQASLHFGFPFCHSGDIADPNFGGLRACSEFTPPAIKLGPHVAALGMRFYNGIQFPVEYENQVFIAEHGSADRSVPVGYQVSLVRFNEAGTPISYEPFAQGWLQPDATLGRPVDIEILPDGSMLVSDDWASAIYRISYTLPRPTPIPNLTPTP
jgi:glucose/arabinose dehydrogenase